MKFVKQYWYLIILFLITVGLGIMVFLTSQQLAKKEPVTQAPPKAAVPACTISFSLAVSPTPTGTPVPTPTGTPGKTPTNTPTPTATPTPAVCNSPCSVNDDCTGDNVCFEGFCRNPVCTGESDCVCPGATATATPTPTNTPTGTPVPTSTPTPTPVTVATCNEACTVNTDCGTGLVCLDNVCRNPSCSEEADCLCEEIAVVPTPKIPVSGGTSLMGAFTIGGGFLLLLLGLLF